SSSTPWQSSTNQRKARRTLLWLSRLAKRVTTVTAEAAATAAAASASALALAGKAVGGEVAMAMLTLSPGDRLSLRKTLLAAASCGGRVGGVVHHRRLIAVLMVVVERVCGRG
ncbi:unnamed protein product, partial [Laminaria digitata]